MLAVATPDAPTFSEHYNPNVELIILTSTPDGSDTLEERYSFGLYFEFIFFAEGDCRTALGQMLFVNRPGNRRYREMMKAFDEVGYYETFTPFHTSDKSLIEDFGSKEKYPTTIFPVTDNTRQ